ncbi:hypothetical protein CUMW_215320 [Citrus unshiu]|uniref:Dehydrogenase E1 component domain-containing protein n=1 Tax=Citrus unshiu TaxID=55188 RepID=A0A2H5QC29_CITUN|nr:hypothetical protein CUMW_215320 [Citrus unshiu]
MALSLGMKNSNKILSQMKSKVGLLSLIKQSSCTCSMNSHYSKTPLTAAPFTRAFKSPDSNFRFSPTLFLARRFESIKAGKQLDSFGSSVNNQFLDFPGGRVAFTPNMRFISESSEERIPCYRVLDDDGQPFPDSSFVKVSEGVAIKMYNDMVTLQTMDTIFYEAQRQGRISFYLTTSGEEAINIASAAAIKNDDFVVPQYREPGVLLWRGFSMQEFANQCFGNKADYGKGRQMPIHYGSNKYNYFTVSSTIATQLPHAVGAAYALKMDRKDACAVTYFGDGGTSEILHALQEAEKAEKPPISDLFTDVYDVSPSNLREQGHSLRETIKKHPQDYPSNVPI